ncbi:peptide terminal cysteine decarboxylase LxmD [Streptomyces neyagawaensis]|uniref:peptide terminal cysteine decarboxylase LxmD n=1 Tax=Streptomyces neyagawaensis TaxID=42238 RepID=UPI0006E1CF19|nr:peptide terminal cysteine decarboxylase LxmD [Streptomyces neyagawaensis]MCL6736050.1 peptide terminal cysteine decarboxylase LxmD [Streptomyces neyagawaensis]MDE1684128.1 peptide terminal cysteine decarboxylase LxmD [Streptomyces neyagawaensis]
MDPTGVADPGFRRVLLVGTGALSVAFLPFWINWLGNTFPEMEKRVVLTRSARRFVSADAISALCGREVVTDDWSEAAPGAVPHVELARWPDLVLVHPATMHFLGRYALGLTDTPLLCALQSTSALVGVAPSLPPGAQLSPVVQGHLDTLRDRPGVVVAPTVPAVSASTGEMEDGGALPLSELMGLCVGVYARARRAEGEDE